MKKGKYDHANKRIEKVTLENWRAAIHRYNYNVKTIIEVRVMWGRQKDSLKQDVMNIKTTLNLIPSTIV